MKQLIKIISILTVMFAASASFAGPGIGGGMENQMAVGPGIGGGMENETKGPGVGGGMEDSSSTEHVYFIGKDQDMIAYAIAKRGRATVKSESVTVMPDGLKQSLRDSRMNKSWEVMSKSISY